MTTALWNHPGTWIALGISLLFIVVAIAMHLVFVRILKAAPPEASRPAAPAMVANGISTPAHPPATDSPVEGTDSGGGR
ncbi:hypothetical protein D8I35_14510 [Corticibacter populi]|uniref:Uncharacterized protein n=1 Tax=Corticibacter populi TaxID=1550736 RepID=A0A3M6QRL2_9BURK|nr:hypothetical protein [Corticibacter populi]RMX05052.1 hypothetical protein D8I35_14510 [Corticibacter populi]RZS33509.1 hypothetical protein EV687_1833 [Corticibacter populi]